MRLFSLDVFSWFLYARRVSLFEQEVLFVHNVQIPKRTYWEGTLHKAVLSYAAILAFAGAMAFTVCPALASQVSCGAVLTTDTVLDSNLSDCPGDGLIIGADNIR